MLLFMNVVIAVAVDIIVLLVLLLDMLRPSPFYHLRGRGAPCSDLGDPELTPKTGRFASSMIMATPPQ